MGSGQLTIDLDALVANWHTLDAISGTGVETAAVVKANGYGLGATRVSRALAHAGVRTFFVAIAEEGAAVRQALGPGLEICVFAGHMSGDTSLIRKHALVPMLNSPKQWARHRDHLPDLPFGVQLDTGMNRLGMEPNEWAALRVDILAAGPRLVMSHLACADEPGHSMNERQLADFRSMTDGIGIPRSLSATGGLLLGAGFHFDVARPGIGLYGGQPFSAALPVVSVSLPVIQVRELAAGETVGYGNTWIADAPARIATVAAGYADGLLRAMGRRAVFYAGSEPCPIRGRVSMDLITVDVTHLREIPDDLNVLSPSQTVDDLARAAGTIGYEILTSLGGRYGRAYAGGPG